MGADLSHLRRSPKAKTASGIGWRDGDYTESPIPRGWPAVPAQEKGIDVGLAVDFVKPAIVGKYDVVVMMSVPRQRPAASPRGRPRPRPGQDPGCSCCPERPETSPVAASAQTPAPLAGSGRLQRRGPYRWTLARAPACIPHRYYAKLNKRGRCSVFTAKSQ